LALRGFLLILLTIFPDLHPKRMKAPIDHLLDPLPDQLAVEAAEKLAAMIGARTTTPDALPPSSEPDPLAKPAHSADVPTNETDVKK
jgi:hypothetical protein